MQVFGSSRHGLLCNDLYLGYDCGFIACSSTMLHDIDDVADFHSESFYAEEQVIVGLDSMCSRHLFPDKSDFASKIKSIVPFEIHGVGGNIKAIGQGTVWLRFRCSSGILHDKLLSNAYYEPNAPVCLISIPQLGRDIGETSTLCTGGSKSIFTWDNIAMMLQNSTPSGVPFLRAYVGHPKHHAFYNICHLAHNYSNLDSTVSDSTTEQNLPENNNNQDISSCDPMVTDVNEHMDDSINHIRSLLRQPLQSDKQREYTFWHHRWATSHMHIFRN